MNIPELLQTEIWGKRTTKKILVGIGIVVVLVIAGSCIWYEVELHWLTSGERNAARAALAAIDWLDTSGSVGIEALAAQKEEAEAKLDAAGAAAKTYRDNFVRMDLGLYFVQVELERGVILPNLDQHRRDKLAATMGDSKYNRKLALHKELD